VDRANGFVYAANLSVGPTFANDTSVLVIDARTDAIVDTITVAPAPSPLAVDPTIGRVFVASHSGNIVSVIQTGDRHRDDR
jgi:DNA-binding beta-propeller fold protein YncE